MDKLKGCFCEPQRCSLQVAYAGTDWLSALRSLWRAMEFRPD